MAQKHEIPEEDVWKPSAAEREALADLRELHLERARVDPAAFASFILKDEETGLPIRMEAFHQEWHDLISAHPRVVIWGAVESGKTQQISIARVLWELGRNPELRIMILSNTDGQAQKITASIAKYIEKDPDVRAVFPNLRPDKKNGWTRHTLIVERDGMQKDPSVQSAGIHSNVTGARIDLLVVDDILDYENSRSETQRNDLDHWLRSTLGGRLTRKSRVIAVGNPWDVRDQLHKWARNTRTYLAVKYPVLNDDGSTNWPERWPVDRIKKFEQENGPVETARQLKCIARDDQSSHFQEMWISKCLDRGEGRELVYGMNVIPDGCEIYTGVDLSTGKPHGHETCLFTIMVLPDESREILDIEAGRWEGPEIVQRIRDVHYRFGSKMIVENVAAQEYILQFTRKESAVPVEPFTTNKSAFRNPAFGVESIGTEMAGGKWIIPCDVGGHGTNRACDVEVSKWIRELLDYDPEKHPGDRLMASYFAREGARRRRIKMRSGRLDLVSR
jgi:hypothetical protein